MILDSQRVAVLGNSRSTDSVPQGKNVTRRFAWRSATNNSIHGGVISIGKKHTHDGKHNPCTTENPVLGTELLAFSSTGRGLGALKELRPRRNRGATFVRVTPSHAGKICPKGDPHAYRSLAWSFGNNWYICSCIFIIMQAKARLPLFLLLQETRNLTIPFQSKQVVCFLSVVAKS